MSVLILSEEEVTEFLPMGECIDAMAAVLAALARGEAQVPLRSMLRGEGSAGILGLMPAYRGGETPVYSLKAVGVFHGNPARGLDAHQGIVTLFDGETGAPTAILNASAVTAIRTAAVSALATRLLAREDATRLAILGSGVQAASHVDAMLAVRPLESISVYSPNAERAAAFVARSAAAHPELSFELAAGPREALAGADIVVTATSSREPVIEHAWLAPGTHVNAVGASLRTHRELDVATVAASELFTDSRESIANEAGEFQLAISEGAIPGPEHVLAVIGELVNGTHPGRSGPQALTVFRSLGIGVEDLAAAELAVANAGRAGAGTEVAL
ncbi:MAG TPA: ornithine cyclodeaminase family protein [Solirubrobacteraceae bacterium]|nr:ornithine cyclodeaminase family protein [Solirubrobacteraceae bacterium]